MNIIIFEKGDPIVHPIHGAGLVIGQRTFVVEGSTTNYLCVELIDEANSQVMIPVDSLEKRGIREAKGSFAILREVMFNEPRELDTDHRTRQAAIRAQVDEGGMRQIVQSLRDLYWHEYSEHLTNTDKRLRMALDRRLQQEMAVANHMSKADAKLRIHQIINAAMEKHTQKFEAQQPLSN